MAFRSDLKPKERHFEEKAIDNEECMRRMIEMKGGTKGRRRISLESGHTTLHGTGQSVISILVEYCLIHADCAILSGEWGGGNAQVP